MLCGENGREFTMLLKFMAECRELDWTTPNRRKGVELLRTFLVIV